MVNPIVYIAGYEVCFIGNQIRADNPNSRFLGNIYRDDIEYTVYASERMVSSRGGIHLKERFRRREFAEIKTL